MVAGGASTVTGSPPDISHVPPHWAAVSGPQPVVRGRELGPPPLKCGPGLVAMPLGPLVQWPLLHRPLAHWAASAQARPSPMPFPPDRFPLPEPAREPFEASSSVLPHAEAPTRLNKS